MQTKFKNLLIKIIELENKVEDIQEEALWAKYKAEDVDSYHALLEDILRGLGYKIPEGNPDEISDSE